MRLLLDTCTFLWLVDDHPNLSARARDAIVDPANDVYLSAASAWEIVIKHAAGRLELTLPVEDYIPRQRELHGIERLPINEDATLVLAKLPAHHRDPFDRILVAQAIMDACSLVTPDPLIKGYPVPILW